MSYNPFHRRSKGDASEFPATVASLPAELDSQPVAASDSAPTPLDALPSDLNPPGAESVPDSGGQDSVPMPVEQRPTIAFVGRYALKGVLGTGGLGQVHEAWDPLLSRPVAVKTLQFDIDPADRESLDELFINEARASAGLSHAHIVTVHDAGRSEHGVYIAMERLQGKDLRQRLGEGWLPTPAQAAQLVRRVADALAYAHARGVVHCDVKPANIFLNKRDKPKVLDFGIARVAHSRVLPKLEGMVAGSPHYLAPEQLQGGALDARTDIHALGVVFYELLTLRKAFTGDTVEQITTAVLTNHPAPAHELRPGVPRTLAGIAAKAMARNPGDRYASAAEMSADLRRWIERNGGQESPAVVEMPGSSLPPGALPLIPPPRARPRRSKTRKSSPVGAVVAVASLVVGGLALLATLRKPPTPEPLPDLTAVPAVAPAAASAVVAALPASAAVELPASAPDVMAVAASAPAATPEPPTVVTVAAVAEPPAPAPAVAAKPAVPVTTAPRAATPRAKATTPKPAPATTGSAAPAAPAAQGQLQLAISPWGQVEVNGAPMGTTPPLTRLNLPEGSHTITVRNEDFPPFSTTVQVLADKPVTIRHRFGQ